MSVLRDAAAASLLEPDQPRFNASALRYVIAGAPPAVYVAGGWALSRMLARSLDGREICEL